MEVGQLFLPDYKIKIFPEDRFLINNSLSALKL